MFDSNSHPSLAGALSGTTPLPLERLEVIVASLIDQVEQLHRSGRLHGSIGLHNVRLDADDRASLTAPAERINLQSEGQPDDPCPPELRAKGPRELLTNLTAAQQACNAARVTFDPRRVDLYQLGVLLCRLSSGQSLASYLRSPKSRGLVPVALRPVVDQALGFNPQNRYSDCAQLAAAFRQAASESQPASAVDTPPLGIAIPRSTDTPASGHPPASAPGLPFEQLGAYRILERIGGGGMGDVYRAHDAALDRIVAIKVLPPELARNADFVQRFRAEAMAIAKLMHPNVVQVFSCGEDVGRHFFVMQFVDGESLAGLLRRRRKLAIEETLTIIEQCLAGLATAHKRNLIHRDIKPGNILLDRVHDRALVADFGLVKVSGGEENLTATGVIMGTVDYIPPEQARGKAVDARSDLYSIGVLMYQMLAGRLPFIADSPTGMIFQHAFEEPTRLESVAPEIPPRLVALVMKLMSKDPADRFQTADQVLEELRAYRTGAPSSLPERSEESKSSIIIAPKFELPAPLSDWMEESASAARPGWLARIWQRVARRPAESSAKERTQFEVDAVVSEYQQRRNQLATLVKEAESVAAEFQDQAAANRQAAAAAGRRAADASDPNVAKLALCEQAECDQTAADLEAQLAEQKSQLEEMRLRLHQVDSTLQRLRSQRDVLQARLISARAQVGPRDPRATRRQSWLAVAAAMVCVATGLVVYGLLSSPSPREAAVSLPAVASTPVEPPTTPLPTIPPPIAPPPVVEMKPSAPVNTSFTAADTHLAVIDPNRRAVEWAMKSGGTATIVVGGVPIEIRRQRVIPTDSFELQSFGMRHALGIKDPAFEKLAGVTGLEVLDMSYNENITDAGFAYAGAQPKLKILQINDTQVTDRAIINLKIDNLQELQASNTMIGDETFALACHWPDLKNLYAARTKVTDRGVAALAGLTKLIDLDLTGTKIGDGALASLPGLPALAMLRLDGAELTDACIPHLTKIKKLQYLSVRDTKISLAGLETLRKATPSCRIVGIIDQTPNSPERQIDPDRWAARWGLLFRAAVWIRPAKGEEKIVSDLGQLPQEPFHVTRILFQDVLCPTDDALGHLEGLTKLNHISLPHTNPSAAGFARLKNVPNLTTLTLNAVTFDKASFAAMTQITQLTSLSLSGSKFDVQSLSALPNLSRLQSLSLSVTKLDDSALSPLAQMTELHTLNLAGVPLTDHAFTHLAKLNKLAVLDLTRTNVQGTGLASLSGLEAMQTLTLDGAPLTEAGLQEIGRFTKLLTLSFSGVTLAETSLASLGNLTSLHNLTLKNCTATSELLSRLAELKSLEKLDLREMEVDSATLAHLRMALPKCNVVHSPPPGR